MSVAGPRCDASTVACYLAGGSAERGIACALLSGDERCFCSSSRRKAARTTSLAEP